MNTMLRRLEVAWEVLRGRAVMRGVSVTIDFRGKTQEFKVEPKEGYSGITLEDWQTVLDLDDMLAYAASNLPSDYNRWPSGVPRPGEVRQVQTPIKRGRGRPRKTPPANPLG